ncbi:Uma2 family endonuclease [Dactylosporangium roseum]|uniref:Uma2 family endonuclease n=1 Tax=Dactylosporangium roseum TaxID=47989 RepID=A0ABY5ZA40_9ACTN|nr:Uma2 family endonuclease [Dactylosporangium roseum]UWZ37662.1 Uma2 family endonuclease [Dactylosporangium roseum]
MSAEAVGRHMPAIITLDDLAAMISADTHGRRYETSPEGVLSVVPPPDSEHAVIATRLMAWLIAAGWPLDQVMQVVGVRIPGPDGDGGRIPDLTVWSRPQPRAVWLAVADLVLVIEIVSRGSEAIDQGAKVSEYAMAGIPQYWTVARDSAQTVTLHRLGADGVYEVTAKMPLAWLLQTVPADHISG